MQIANESTPRSAAPMRAQYKVLLVVVIVAVLLGVFMLYADPELMITIADQLWACL